MDLDQEHQILGLKKKVKLRRCKVGQITFRNNTKHAPWETKVEDINYRCPKLSIGPKCYAHNKFNEDKKLSHLYVLK